MSAPSAELSFDELLGKKREQMALAHRQRIAALPQESLRWLAFAPGWTTELATAAGFPASGDVQSFFENAVRQGLSAKRELPAAWEIDTATGRLSRGTPQVLYTAPLSTAREVIESNRDESSMIAVSKDVANIARSMLRATSKGVPVDPAIRMWAELASHADPDASYFLLQTVDQTLANNDFATAARWIEAATSLEKVLQGPLTQAVYLASLRYLLRQQQVDAAKPLERFVLRPDQMESFQTLLRGPDTQWALHYAGVGGVGKTMLMRYLQAKAIPELGGAVARVDFDYLNPQYPSTKPALLLVQLAEELRLHDQKGLASSYFESFSRKAVTFHEGLTTNIRPVSPLQLIRDSTFQILLDTFGFAAKELPQPVVLILDTCEELSKMLSDGTVPDNVSATFEVLESLQKRLPGLRVVFSGRRPLASSGAGDWKAVSSPLGGITRPYLRLHEIRGFERDTAVEFLQNKAGCPGNLIEAVLSRCPERAYTRQFEWPDHAAPAAVPRYSPYELSLYASWIATDDKIDTHTILWASFDQYVKARVISRLRGSGIHALLPALAWLGRFDDASVLELSEVPSGSDEARAILDEVLRQEWIERQPGGFSEIERGLRPLLFDYYKKNNPALLEKCRVACATYLEQRTTAAPLSSLDLSHFEAMERVLHPEPERAASWWQQVEAAVLQQNAYGFILLVTHRLLSPEFWQVDTPDTQGIRAAIAATQAAALLQTNHIQELEETWRLVGREAQRHPFPARANQLRLLAEAAGGNLATVLEFPGPMDEQVAAAVVQFVDLASDEFTILSAHGTLDERSSARLKILRSVTERIAQSPVSEQLHAFALLMQGQIQTLLREPKQALNAYRLAFLKTASLTKPDPRWLHLVNPANTASRIQLEFLRRVYPSALSPTELRWLFPEFSAMAVDIDSDRLAAAILALHCAETAFQPPNRLWFLPQNPESSVLEPTTESHYQFPPFFIAATEEQARSGYVEQSLKLLNDHTRQHESAATSYHAVIEASRACARIIRRYRLMEEGYGIPDSLQTSDDGEDVKLRQIVIALSMADSTPRITAQASPALTHFEPAFAAHTSWSVTQAGGPPEQLVEAFQSLVPHATNNTFLGLCCRLDLQELTELRGAKLLDPATAKLPRPDIAQWWHDHPQEPVEALTLWLRNAALYETPPPPRELAARLGTRRAATIALEEGELLALRLPARAQSILQFAIRHFNQCGDALSELLAQTCLALSYARLDTYDKLAQSIEAIEHLFAEEGVLQPGNPPADSYLLSSHSWSLIQALLDGEYPWQDNRREWTRPWLLRIAACVAFHRDGPTSIEHRVRIGNAWQRSSAQLPLEGRACLSENLRPYWPVLAAPAAAAAPDPSLPQTEPNDNPVATTLATTAQLISIRSERTRSSGSLFDSTAFVLESGERRLFKIESLPPSLPYSETSRMWSNLFEQLARVVRLAVDRNSAWPCWEAPLTASGASLVIRQVSDRHRQNQPSLLVPRYMHTVTGTHAGANLAGTSVTLNEREGNNALSWSYSNDLESMPGRLRPDPGSHILHIFGDPVETRAGLRIELNETSAGPHTASMESRGILITADEASRCLPEIRMAILQCPIIYSGRTGAHREKAAYLRSFAAELHTQIPWVVTLPAIDDFDLATQVLARLIRYIELPAFSARGLLEARKLLSDSGRTEESLDICLYGDLP